MAQTRRDPQPWTDAIVNDVRTVREGLLAACGYDLTELVKRLRQEQEADDREAIRRPARRAGEADRAS